MLLENAMVGASHLSYGLQGHTALDNLGCTYCSSPLLDVVTFLV